MSLDTELASAAGYGELEEVKRLVSLGANITSNALNKAATQGYLDVIKYLVENGAEVIPGHNYALNAAVENGFLDIVKYLNNHGADLFSVPYATVYTSLRNNNFDVVKYFVQKGYDMSWLDLDLLRRYGRYLFTRSELEELLLKQTSKYNLNTANEVYSTLPNELLYKIRSYMQVKGLDVLDIKNVYTPKHPLHKIFGEYIEDKPFLIKNFVFKRSDLENLPDIKSEKFDLGYAEYPYSYQQHLDDKKNIVIQLNFKEEYLDKIFKIKGNDFKNFYENLCKGFVRDGHPVLPYPGRTYGWARVYILENAWLVNEIQTDWKHLISVCKQLSGLEYIEDIRYAGLHPRFASFFTSPENIEWGKFIGETMLENFDELIMSSILSSARRNGVSHIYMLTDKNMNAQDLGASVKKDLYHKTPRKFKFHKVVTDLGAGDQEYWYRTANILDI